MHKLNQNGDDGVVGNMQDITPLIGAVIALTGAVFTFGMKAKENDVDGAAIAMRDMLFASMMADLHLQAFRMMAEMASEGEPKEPKVQAVDEPEVIAAKERAKNIVPFGKRPQGMN